MSPAELKSMACAWNELLEKAGMRIAWNGAVWRSTTQNSLEATVTVQKTAGTRLQSPRSVGYFQRTLHERVGPNVFKQEYGVVASVENMSGITMSWSAVQNLEVGTSGGTVCWHGECMKTAQDRAVWHSEAEEMTGWWNSSR